MGRADGQGPKKGHVIAAADGLIAATALRHGLRVMTRNERDFRVNGVASSTRGRKHPSLLAEDE